jgi:hypothetical protein
MVTTDPNGAENGASPWQFYENTEHMNFWYEHRYYPPKGKREGTEAVKSVRRAARGNGENITDITDITDGQSLSHRGVARYT